MIYRWCRCGSSMSLGSKFDKQIADNLVAFFDSIHAGPACRTTSDGHEARRLRREHARDQRPRLATRAS